MWRGSALAAGLRRCLSAACVATVLFGAAAFGQIADLQWAAEGGSAEAQLALARAYDLGQLVPQDFVQAQHWYRLAAEAGDAFAQNRLGHYLRSGLAGPPSPQEAAEWLARAAQSGDPQYVYDLATAYEAGFGVPRDAARAAGLYGAAAAKGHLEAAVSLGVLYQQGIGVAQDFDRARELFSGAAEAGNARAQNNLGLLYARGDGVPQDYVAAAHWFKLAADARLATAMTNLGRMYQNGFGVKLDETAAAELYRRAGADPAVALFAQGAIGDPYMGLPDRSADSMRMIRAGAAAGDPIAQVLLAQTLLLASDQNRQPAEAAALFRAAAENGVGSAMANLGLLYFRGDGVPQDYVLGYMWLSLAVSAGLDGAAALRDAMIARLTAGQVREAQALAAEWAAKR